MTDRPKKIPKPPENKNKESLELAEWQYRRLNAFLVTSAFLVAAFFTLIGIDICHHSFISCETKILLIHFVVGLGSIIASAYTFINFMSDYKTDFEHHVTHTWGVPLIILVFWVLTWWFVTNWWPCFVIAFGSPLVYLAIHLVGRNCLQKFLKFMKCICRCIKKLNKISDIAYRVTCSVGKCCKCFFKATKFVLRCIKKKKPKNKL